MTIASELLKLDGTKTAIKTAIEAQGVTVGAVAFDQYASKIDLIEGGGDPPFVPPTWTRPTEWVTLPTVGSEQKIVALHDVYPGDNLVSFAATGNYTIDWGDGVTENYNGGTACYHNYDYTNSAFDGTLTSDGYKQAIVVVTPQSGQNFTAINFNYKHNQSGLVDLYSTGWREMIINAPNCTLLDFGGGASSIKHGRLQRMHVKSVVDTGMDSMFRNMGALESVSIDSVSTSVTTVEAMFQYCYKLKVVTLWDTVIGSNFNTSSMFDSCTSLTYVPLFNTDNCTNMLSMFLNCTSLVEVPFFNTVKVTNMTAMFAECYSLTSVPLFDTGAVTTMATMFRNCSSLATVPLFNTANVTSMSSMFSNTRSLTSVPFFNTVKVDNMSSMFDGCYSLITVPLFNTGAVTTMATMFRNCYSLTTVPLFNTANVTTMATMFNMCYSLVSIPLFNTVKVTTMDSFLFSCTSLPSIPAFNTSVMTNATSMLRNCPALTSIPAMDFNAITTTTNMFASSASIRNILATGIKNTFSVANLSLSGTELNALYGRLANVVGKTLTVTGNYGTASDNPTIATAKGWTVSG